MENKTKINFKEKMQVKADKPKIELKHSISKAKSSNNAQLTMRIPNKLNLEFELLKADISFKDNSAFFANDFFLKILNKIQQDFENGKIEKDYEKYLTKRGQRPEDNETNKKRNIRLPFSLKASLKKGIVEINKKYNIELSLQIIFIRYMKMEMKKLEDKYKYL